MRVLGLILVIVGIIGLAWGGISYMKHKEVLEVGDLKEVLEVGDLSVQTTERETIPIPPWASGLVLGIGVVMVVMDRRRM